MANVTITLRAKGLKDGRKSLYLDIWNKGTRKHTHATLHLYLVGDAAADAKIKAAANLALADALTEYGSTDAHKDGANVGFTDYLTHYADRKRAEGQSAAYSEIVCAMGKQFAQYADTQAFTIADITPHICKGFSQWLQAQSIGSSTQAKYYATFAQVLKAAQADDYLQTDPTNGIKRPKAEGSARTYLQPEELAALTAAPCPNAQVKAAFLFACFTGLRISDIEALTWGNIEQTANGMQMRLTMVKTRKVVVVPISAAAAAHMGTRGAASEKVFKLPTYQYMASHTLKQWAAAAHLTKNLTFHASRHTFATLALASGTDLYTISKLLGHTSVNTTTIYAEVTNAAKRAAVEAIAF